MCLQMPSPPLLVASDDTCWILIEARRGASSLSKLLGSSMTRASVYRFLNARIPVQDLSDLRSPLHPIERHQEAISVVRSSKRYGAIGVSAHVKHRPWMNLEVNVIAPP